MTKKKIILLIIFAVILGGIAAGLLLYNQPGFTGNRVANPDSYTLEIQRMHGTDRHTMALNAGDVLQIHFETEKGSLHLEITAPDGTVLYTGNGGETRDFTVNIPQDGTYSVTVEAKHAKGILRIQKTCKVKEDISMKNLVLNGNPQRRKHHITPLILILLFICILAGCARGKKTPASMNIDTKDGKTIRTGTEVYTYQLEAGQTGILSVRVARESGRLDLDIYPTGGEDEAEYTGRDMDNAAFNVTLKSAGEYTVRFTADQFIGEYGIEWKTMKGNEAQ